MTTGPKKRTPAEKLWDLATMYGTGLRKIGDFRNTKPLSQPDIDALTKKYVDAMINCPAPNMPQITATPQMNPATRELMRIIEEIISENNFNIVRVQNTRRNEGFRPSYVLAKELIARFDAIAIMAGEPDAPNN